MKLPGALLILLMPLCYSFPECLTNTVIDPVGPIESYKIEEYSLLKDPSILITREFETRSGKILHYFIDTKNLTYGITDEWKTGDFTSPSAAPSLFSSLKSIQLSGKRPFGSDNENFMSAGSRAIVLTSDLCPTSKHFAKLFYDSLDGFDSKREIKVPLVIFFSGQWLESHAGDLSLIKKYNLNFIAGNHTYRHRISSKGSGVDFLTFEITNTERIMLENGLLPSFIFRFPGLLYSYSDIECLNSINIISLNANAWMGDRLRNWNILLVHSNGNAMEEVESFSRLLSGDNAFTGSDKLVFSGIRDYFRLVAESADTGQ